MMQANNHQINLLRSSDIISPTIDFSLFLTDAKIDATYNRTLYGSNVVISVGIPRRVQEMERILSGCFPVVEIEHTPEPLATLNRPIV